jgi:hypothetical protein
MLDVLSFDKVYTAINPPTPTVRFGVRWHNGARWKACPLHREFCMAQGDDLRFVGSARDATGALQDLGGAQEIIWALYDRQGGTEVVRLALSDDDIRLGGPEEFYFSIRNATSKLFTRRTYWHETLIVNSDGWRNTCLAGVFSVHPTNIGDI